jgi:hypothetical protein
MNGVGVVRRGLPRAAGRATALIDLNGYRPRSATATTA